MRAIATLVALSYPRTLFPHTQKELWSALTLTSEVDGNACTIKVLNTSPFLLSIACSSRIYADSAGLPTSKKVGSQGPSRAGALPDSCLGIDPWQQYYNS